MTCSRRSAAGSSARSKVSTASSTISPPSPPAPSSGNNRSLDAMNLEAYLTEQRIDAKLIHLWQQTTTARMAAEALGVSIEVVIKSILFQAKEGALVLVI